RVLGNMLGISGFDYDSADAVKREVLGDGDIARKLDNRIVLSALASVKAPVEEGLQRVGEVPIYSSDPLVRRSPPLQKTRDAEPPAAFVSPVLYERLGLRAGDFLRVRSEGAEIVVPVEVDSRLPHGCIRLAAARPETAALGAMFGTVTAERVAAQQKVAV
ncbi:MAG: molybdopterin dinucleotide binding domain-containing protein, partial [Burkholderiales bacterium]